ncbi:MAG: DNA cytosine methyltransferase, partial [Gammaproteobacteria bacterium]|nr:DNA cytosine methyltransferase [Gammaproteobacteria bacterium]
RALTNREKARLQSFSDWLVFTGGKESVRKQIGMAMPPKGADAVFRQILETLLKYTIQPCQDIISVEESQSVPQKSRAGNILRFQHEAQEANY